MQCSLDLLPVLLDGALAGVAACSGQGGVPPFGTVGAVPLIVWKGGTQYRGWHSVQGVALNTGGGTQCRW